MVFPEQIEAPRQHAGIANWGEGLYPWQIKKLYYFSDATHPDFLKGHGPTYLASETSSAKKVPYADITRQMWKQYATQVDFDDQVLNYFVNMPEYLVLGKSLVPAPVDADVWAGIEASRLPLFRCQNISRTRHRESALNLVDHGPFIKNSMRHMA